MHPCTLIGSNKGGVGKSLLAQLVVAAYDQAYESSSLFSVSDERTRYPLRVVEIDNQKRLHAVLGDRVNLSLNASPSMAEIERDRGSASSYFNQMYDEIASGPSLVDLGANVTSPLFQWAEMCDVKRFASEDGIRFRFVAVTTPDSQALHAALAALRTARSALGDSSELFLALNDVTGETGYRFFEETDLWERIKALAHQNRIGLINIPYCDSKLMEWSRARDCTIKELLCDGTEIANRAVSEAGLPRVTARIEASKFLKWITTVQDEMAPIFAKPGLRAVA